MSWAETTCEDCQQPMRVFVSEERVARGEPTPPFRCGKCGAAELCRMKGHQWPVYGRVSLFGAVACESCGQVFGEPEEPITRGQQPRRESAI